MIMVILAFQLPPPAIVLRIKPEVLTERLLSVTQTLCKSLEPFRRIKGFVAFGGIGMERSGRLRGESTFVPMSAITSSLDYCQVQPDEDVSQSSFLVRGGCRAVCCRYSARCALRDRRRARISSG